MCVYVCVCVGGGGGGGAGGRRYNRSLEIIGYKFMNLWSIHKY